MSGGVDSSVAAHLMVESGYECTGMTMKLFENEDIGVGWERSCCSLKDSEDARQVAEGMNMPFYILNYSQEFNEQVIGRFIEAYKNGETPNPCIDCNRYIKFDQLLNHARELHQDYIVTGHYARVEYSAETGRYLLKKGVDESKDQSYVLYSLTQEQLAHTLFPLGAFRKTEVREIARRHGFVNAQKHDSQDICFVLDGDYPGFIQQYTGETFEKGRFVGVDGKDFGENKGIVHYTVGQRRGLGIAAPKPLYVCSISPEDNTVVIGERENLFSRSLVAKDINLIAQEKLEGPVRVKAKVRYKQPEQPAVAEQLEDGTLRVTFDEPQRAISKGQAVVLYDGDVIVGGGTICAVE